MAGWRRWAALALCASALGGATACDPCAGTASCVTGPRLAVAGQIVEPELGKGVGGVTVSVVSGSDSLSDVTDAEGFWEVDGAAPGAESGGTATVDVVVATPGSASYRVRNVSVPPITRRGDAHLLDRWVATPYFAAQVELFYRFTVDTRVANAGVELRRTGGVALRDPADSVVRSTTDRFGRANLLRRDQVALEFGDLVGDLTVTLPGNLGTSVVHQLRIPNTYVYRATPGVQRFPVGPNLTYLVQVYNRATGQPQPGATVSFTRTGGVGTTPASVSKVSDANGFVLLQARPLAAGTVTGRLVITAPAPARPETLQVSLPTFDADTGRLLRNVSVGPHLPYYGFVRAAERGLAGVPVTMRRTGGIAIEPATWTATTTADGVLFLNPRPLAIGEVVLELQFKPPAPYAAFTVRNLRLSTVERDAPAGLHVWTWDVDRAPSGPPGTQVTTP